MLLALLLASALPAQYMGSQACRACHAAKFATQSKTGHARALALAPAGSPGHWAFGAGEKATTYVSQSSEPEWYVEHGLSYYAATKSMAPTPGHSGGADLRFRTFESSATTLRCFRCHSTGPLRVTAGRAIEPSELGVRCESCHGAGSAHVKAAGAKGTIRNPRQLKAAELNDFCGSCHRKPPEVGDEDDLSNSWNIRHQPSSLSRASCFRNSGGALSCLTCHDPHMPLSRVAAEYDKRCSACHRQVRHQAALGSRACIDCHMPQVTTSAELRFTNHWIGVYEGDNKLMPSRRVAKRLSRVSKVALQAGPGDAAGLAPLFESAASPADYGLFLKSVGNNAAAEVQLRKSLKTAADQENLATVLVALGKLKEAFDLFRKGADGEDAAVAARCFSSLAILDPAQAESYYRSAIEAEEKASGKDHPRVAMLLNDLALALRQAGDDRSAEPLLRRALAIEMTSVGADSPLTATMASNLGNLLQGAGRLDEAERLEREALRIFEKKLGPESGQLSTTCTYLADVLWSKGDRASAARLYRRALSIDESIYGLGHAQVAGDLVNLGSVLKESGEAREADILLRRALAIFTQAIGPDSQEANYVREKMR